MTYLYSKIRYNKHKSYSGKFSHSIAGDKYYGSNAIYYTSGQYLVAFFSVVLSSNGFYISESRSY